MNWTAYTQSPDQATRFLAASIEHSSNFQVKKLRRVFPEMIRSYLEFSGKTIDEPVPFGPNNEPANKPEDWRLYLQYPYRPTGEPFELGGHWWIRVKNVFSHEDEVFSFTDERAYSQVSLDQWLEKENAPILEEVAV